MRRFSDFRRKRCAKFKKPNPARKTGSENYMGQKEGKVGV